MKMRPVAFVWRNEVMVPVPRFLPLCRRQFEDGEEYPLEMVEERSLASHNFFFASVHEAWLNLPEDVAKRFPTAEHLRKWSLVQVGYCDEANYVLETPKDAKQMAAAVRRLDDFAVIVPKGNVVQVFTAKSQSARAMKRKAFEGSKREVLDLLASMTSVTRAALEKAGEQHAPRTRPVIEEGTRR